MFFKKTDIDTRLRKAQGRMQPHAQAIAANNGAKLDYTEASIKEIDRILVNVSNELEQAGITKELQIVNNDGVKGIAESLGSYIAECAERHQGEGKWVGKDPETLEDWYGLILPSGAVIFPFDWVVKKLLDPKGYSVYATYTHFVL